MRLSAYHAILVLLSAAGAALATSACALTSKAGVVEVRYFNPERMAPRVDQVGALRPQPTSTRTLQLRLGRVSSGPNLRERIAYRDSAYELGYYEDLRWTERPETYVRRELGRALFETRGLQRTLTGSAPTLEVELIAFDELRTKATRSAQIQLMVVLYDDNGVILEETQTTEAPVVGEATKVENVIDAMATALYKATSDLALKVSIVLGARNLATPAEPSSSSKNEFCKSSWLENCTPTVAAGERALVWRLFSSTHH